jgi:hypothetical protein
MGVVNLEKGFFGHLTTLCGGSSVGMYNAGHWIWKIGQSN